MFRELPIELEEAAMVDGANRLQSFLWVALPLVVPGLVATWIICLAFSWNEFLFALTFIRSQDQLPLTIGLFKFVTRFQVQWHQLMAASLLTTIVVVALFMLVQNQLTRGMVALGEK
jgi:ABC-type glycerol-3-phosphate transport system permease component